MTLQQLIYFQKVAETLHFTKASEELFVAQSSLSHAVQMLEREIGAPLFIRKTGSGITLTDYGRAFLPYVNSILKSMDEGKRVLEDMIDSKKGTVNIAYSYFNGCNEVPKIIKAFYNEEKNKNIELRTHVNHSEKYFIGNQIACGNVDIGFSCYTFPDRNQLASIPLFKQKLYIVMPTEHPLAKEKSLRLEQVKEEPLIAMSSTTALYDHTMHMYEECGIVPKLIDSLMDWTSQLDMISYGRGISILPLVPFNSENLAFVPLDHPMNERTVYMLWPIDRSISPVSEAFRKFCLKYYNNRK